MEPTEEDIGVEALSASIEKLNKQAETLKRLQSILENVPEDAHVYVEDARDSGQIHVILRADELIEAMEELAYWDMTLQTKKSNPDNIEYDIEEEEYELEKKFRTDR